MADARVGAGAVHGAEPWLGASAGPQRLLTSSGQAVLHGADRAAARLTPREREVLGYLHLGYSNQQIALALGSAPRTVRNQLSRVYDKLGVGTRAEAVAWALGRPEQTTLSR
jgi:DNA-binding NarL/FixJ family response regulator